MNTNTTLPRPQCDLASLHLLPLDSYHQSIFEMAKPTCGGPAFWRSRKLAEAFELAALAQLSRRVVILRLDLSSDLRAELLLKCPVPCLREPNGELELASTAHLGLIYRQAAILQPQPGYSFIQVLAPRAVWLPNLSPDIHQVLCLGASLPANIPVRELIFLAYSALTLQTAQMDPGNAAGVLNLVAAEWWQRNVSRMPLTREPFLGRESAPAPGQEGVAS